MIAVRDIAIDQAAEDAAFVAAIKAAAEKERDPAIREWLEKFVTEARTNQAIERTA